MSPRKVEPPYRFFVDECLGREDVPDAMKAHLLDGEKVIRSFERFKSGAKDDAWLPKVGAEGLVVITKDGNFRFRPNELQALLDAKTGVFVIASDSGPAMAKLVVEGMPTMRRVLRGKKVPLVGRIHPGGDIIVLMEDGEKCNKRVKRPVKGM